MSIDDRTPVLVGVAAVSQREDDPDAAGEPLDLMVEATRRAADDAGATGLLAEIGWIGVPHGRWDYADPGRAVAEAVGATTARTTFAEVGVLQQTLIGSACEAISAGQHQATLVVGGEAGHRIRRAGLLKREIRDRPAPGEPDVVLTPAEELKTDIERAVGLDRAVGYYAMLESAFRASEGRSVEEGRRRIAAIYSRMSAVAAGNPDAWRPVQASAAELEAAEPMLSFPYNRAFVSSWSVDQAGALIFCSVALAERLGIPESRWVFPVCSVESNHMVSVSARAELAAPPAVDLTVAAAMDHGGRSVEDLDLIDLYSCFPVAVQMLARALGVDPLERDVTITGGMPWAGGPYNNYVLQSTVRMAQLLRERPGATGLTTCVSGLMTKIGAAVWSSARPAADFRNIDVTAAVGELNHRRDTVVGHTGAATVCASTVLHGPTGPQGILLLDTPDGRRTMASVTEDPVVASLARDEWIGRTVQLDQGALVW